MKAKTKKNVIKKSPTKPIKTSFLKKYSRVLKYVLAALSLYVAFSLYQLIVKGEGPLTYLTGSPEVMMITYEGAGGAVSPEILMISTDDLGGVAPKPVVKAPTTSTTTTVKKTVKPEDGEPAPVVVPKTSASPSPSPLKPIGDGLEVEEAAFLQQSINKDKPASVGTAPAPVVKVTAINPVTGKEVTTMVSLNQSNPNISTQDLRLSIKDQVVNPNHADLNTCCRVNENPKACISSISGRPTGRIYEKTIIGKQCGTKNGDKLFPCTDYFNPLKDNKKGNISCLAGGVGGGNYKYPLTADDACKSVVPPGTPYVIAGQARYGQLITDKCADNAFDVWFDNTQQPGVTAANCSKANNYQGCKGYARCCVKTSDFNKKIQEFCDSRPIVAIATNKKTGAQEQVEGKIKSGGMKFDCSTGAQQDCLATGNYSQQLPTDIYSAPTIYVPDNNNQTYQGCQRMAAGKVKSGYCCPNILNQQ